MNETKKSNIALSLAIVGIMFFAIGFALGINSFLLPVLKSAIPDTKTYANFIIAATFLPFLLFGYPASMTIKKIGYKKTMALSFVFFAVAFSLFIPAARSASFTMFLIASFVSGVANAFLQASVNPYVTILGPLESAAKRISIMGICNKLAWPVAPVFLTMVINKSIDQIVLPDLYTPFYIIIGVFLLLGVIAYCSSLPEVKAAGEEEEEDNSNAEECEYANSKTSVFQFPHLLLGCLALFLYVGCETIALSTLVDYATNIGLPNPDMYAWISSIGMVIGYICGIIFIPKYISQDKAMIICAIVALIGSVAVVFTPKELSIWFIFLIALGCSLMWPALWPMAMNKLGKFTKAGSSLLIMAMAGPVIILPLLGMIEDMQKAYGICIPCFLFILYYGAIGHKAGMKNVK